MEKFSDFLKGSIDSFEELSESEIIKKPVNGKEKFYFDMDDTLITNDKTKLRVHVLDPNGKRVKTLTSKEFNSYPLPKNHSFDYSEFRSSDVFAKSSKPIKKMITKMISLKNAGHDVEILTARGDFDDKHKFKDQLKKFGIDITPKSGIHVRRVGDRGDNPARQKADFVDEQIKKHGLKKVHIFDDSLDNINSILGLHKRHEGIEMHGYHVNYDPEKEEINITKYKKENIPGDKKQ